MPGTADAPSVTLRLTRLDPSPADLKEHDPRIARTIEELRVMSIDVQLGERDERLLWEPPDDASHRPRTFQPISRINLDLSVLIALVSDLTYAPLDSSHSRFLASSRKRCKTHVRCLCQGSGFEIVSTFLSTYLIFSYPLLIFGEPIQYNLIWPFRPP